MAARQDRGLLLTTVVVALAVALAAASSQGLIYAALAVAAAAYVLVLATIGLRATGICFLVLAFAAAPMYRGIEFLTGGTVPPTDVLAALAIIHLVPGCLHHRLRAPTVYLVGLVLLSTSCLIAVIVTGDVVDNGFFTVQWLFFLGVLPLIIGWWRPSLTVVEWLLWGYLVGHMLSTAAGLAEGAVSARRYDGLTHHPNAFGLAGVTAIAIVLFLVHRHTDVKYRAVLAAVAAASLGSIVLSGSRAAIVVLVALVLLVPVVERSALAGFALAGGVAIVILSLPLIVGVSGEDSAIGRLAGEGTAAASDEFRNDSLDLGFDRLWESPLLGSGFEDIVLIHNVFLEVAVAIGVIGLVSYLIVMFAMARPLFSRHPLRRLTYIVWAFLGVAATFPGLWDRTVWVPASLAMLAMLDPRDQDESIARLGEVEPEPLLRA